MSDSTSDITNLGTNSGSFASSSSTNSSTEQRPALNLSTEQRPALPQHKRRTTSARWRASAEITPPRAPVSAGAAKKLKESDILTAFKNVRDSGAVQYHWYSADDWCLILLRRSPSTFANRETQLSTKRLVRALNKLSIVGEYSTNEHGLYCNRHGHEKTYYYQVVPPGNPCASAPTRDYFHISRYDRSTGPSAGPTPQPSSAAKIRKQSWWHSPEAFKAFMPKGSHIDDYEDVAAAVHAAIQHRIA